MKYEEIVERLETGSSIYAYRGNAMFFEGWQKIPKKKITSLAKLFGQKSMLVIYRSKEGDANIICNDERYKYMMLLFGVPKCYEKDENKPCIPS